MTKFEDFGCEKFVCSTLRQVNINEPSNVQKGVIKHIINGYNCNAISQTGTGKTAAFALPIVSTLSKDPYGIYALVLSPTRELADQIGKQFRLFGKGVHIKVSIILGGESIRLQSTELENNPHIVVGTPGRILHHLEGNTDVDFSNIRYFVLDEVDRLFKDNFWPDIIKIIKYLPEKRQTLLFSATFSDEINLNDIITVPPIFKKLPLPESEGVSRYSDDGYTLYWEPTEQSKPKILHKMVQAASDDSREVYLIILLEGIFAENEYSQVIVFCETCERSEVVTIILRSLKYKAAVLHSKMDEDDRLEALESFRSGAQRILVSTNVSSRGLDIPLVDFVIHFHPPQSEDIYIHRSGRTGRAGRSGESFLLVTKNDSKIIQKIEKRIGQKLEEVLVDPEELKQRTNIFEAKMNARVSMYKKEFGKREEMLKELDKKFAETNNDIEQDNNS